jgi:integrase/recombinase XerD
MNISEHSALFIQEMKRRGFSENTIKTYYSNLVLFLGKQTKDHPKNVNEQDIRNYLAAFKEQNTQRSHHSAIKLFYEICMNQKDKFRYLPYAKKSNKLPIVLSPEEVQKMFNACTNLKHRAIFALLYACGLRVSEVINLQIKDVDSSRMVINILQAKGKKDRQVMLPQSLLDLLRAYFKEYKPQVYLFNGQNSLQYSARSINEFLKQIAQKAGVDNKRIYAHLIRHCTFTHMLENGVDLTIIQKIAGHSSIKTTQGYTHISNSLITRTYSPISSIRI